ncbi:MAG: hypothetical protein COB20_11980 [SAR86 cluster bacterium]|uniref:Uncharacterized protein n=1 Tax=SAR86 cluster bacterium TaxID=2030880 RepID=A0A2A4WZN2_9GAMM|nr:MAG: hypothetical protein COB20_11980 [SAR86 cluster bacterium]
MDLDHRISRGCSYSPLRTAAVTAKERLYSSAELDSAESADFEIRPAETAKAIAPASHKKPLIVELSLPLVNAKMESINQMNATIQQSDLEYLAKPVP